SPPMRTSTIRWPPPPGKGASALDRIAAEIWSGRDAMMSRIPPGSTCATARGSNIGSLMGPAEIRPPSLQVATNKLVPTTILIYAAQLLRIRGTRARARRPAARGVHPRVRRRRPRRGNGPHDRQRVRESRIGRYVAEGHRRPDL